MKWGVLIFPGSNCDQDCVHVLRDVLQQEVVELWHQDTQLQGVDAVVIPGGFSYGDYLRCGAIAKLSPMMQSVKAFAEDGGLVIGICNGFQILLESGLLKGALLPNTGLRFICEFVYLRVERTDTPFTYGMKKGQVLHIPIAHYDGRYTVNPENETIAEQTAVFRYCDAQGNIDESSNPNGSFHSIAGVVNEKSNVLGLMPHPERAAESVLGGTDGRLLFESMIRSFEDSQVKTS